MRTRSNKPIKFVKYEAGELHLKVSNDGKVNLLGSICTRKGGLTREQKLKAVAAAGEWVQI